VPRKTDYDRMAAVYDLGRSLPLEGLTEWRHAVAPLIAGRSPVLDLGAGTGIWAAAFVQWFEIEVAAIEPSANMRARAARARSHPQIFYVGGRSERIPLGDRSCGCAWLSTVVHHFDDLPASAHELRRVLHDGAPVLIRSAFAGRTSGVNWLRFWPDACARAERRWPSVDHLVAVFSQAGFEIESIRSVPQTSAPSLAAYRDRLAQRADSTLAELSESEFEVGMKALEAAVANESTVTPVVDRLDLLVLR
jgi:SAM-dependent methyltransferase